MIVYYSATKSLPQKDKNIPGNQSEGRNGNIELPGGDDGQGVGHDYEILVVVVVVVGRRPPESCIC